MRIAVILIRLRLPDLVVVLDNINIYELEIFRKANNTFINLDSLEDTPIEAQKVYDGFRDENDENFGTNWHMRWVRGVQMLNTSLIEGPIHFIFNISAFE